jgi:hypothetical protein
MANHKIKLNVIDLLIMKYLLACPIKARIIVKKVFEGCHVHGNPKRKKEVGSGE